jgi:hypothetical protein
MVSGPLHETTPGSPATAIRIPVALCGVPGVKTKTSPRRSKGLDATTHRGLTESSGEVSLLDILSHRMSGTSRGAASAIVCGKTCMTSCAVRPAKPQKYQQSACLPRIPSCINADGGGFVPRSHRDIAMVEEPRIFPNSSWERSRRLRSLRILFPDSLLVIGSSRPCELTQVWVRKKPTPDEVRRKDA